MGETATTERDESDILALPRMTMAEAAKKAGVDLSTLWRWALTGCQGDALPTLKIGRKRFVLAADLNDFVIRRSKLDPPRRTPSGSVVTKRAAKANADLERAGW